MRYSSRLEEGIFLKRYKRFFADIEWQGNVVTAHVPNTGSMKGCNEAGNLCRLSISDNPTRKLKYTLEMIRTKPGTWVGVNTAVPNQLVREALEAQLLPHWQGITRILPEFRLSPETRLDFAVEKESAGHSANAEPFRHFIEVKNVTMAEGARALFPDAVTERGQKHLRELMRLKDEGHEVELVFTIQRDDVDHFAPADGIDPEYGRLLREAQAKGVRLTPLVVQLSDAEARLTDQLLRVEL